MRHRPILGVEWVYLMTGLGVNNLTLGVKQLGTL